MKNNLILLFCGQFQSYVQWTQICALTFLPFLENVLFNVQYNRQRERERQRDRETERQRDRETERQRDRETEISRGIVIQFLTDESFQ